LRGAETEARHEEVAVAICDIYFSRRRDVKELEDYGTPETNRGVVWVTKAKYAQLPGIGRGGNESRMD
jgi:hypothetical protein